MISVTCPELAGSPPSLTLARVVVGGEGFRLPSYLAAGVDVVLLHRGTAPLGEH